MATRVIHSCSLWQNETKAVLGLDERCKIQEDVTHSVMSACIHQIWQMMVSISKLMSQNQTSCSAVLFHPSSQDPELYGPCFHMWFSLLVVMHFDIPISLRVLCECRVAYFLECALQALWSLFPSERVSEEWISVRLTFKQTSLLLDWHCGSYRPS